MKLNKIKTYNITELVKEYKEKALKLKQYELDLKSGKEKDSSKVKLFRRDVARILTLLNQKIQLEEVESILENIKAASKEKIPTIKEVDQKEEVIKKVKEVVKEKKEVKTTTKKEVKKKSIKKTIKK